MLDNLNIGLPQVDRSSKSINSFISGFGQASSKISWGGYDLAGMFMGGGKGGELKYPIDKNTPKELFVVISVYDGKMDASIDAMTQGVSAVQDGLSKVFGAGTGEGGVGGALGKTGKIFSGISSGISGAISNFGGALGSAVNSILGALGSGDWGNGSVAGYAKSFELNIYLPLPNELTEAVSHTYDEEDGWIETASTAMGGTLTAGVQTVAKAAALISKITGSRGLTYNKNKISMYSGTEFRSITMTWTLVPNNQKESIAIHQIIKELKKYSSPQSVGGKLLLRSPHFFRLKFNNKILDNAMQFHEVNITNVAVDYNPGGSMEMNQDMTPKSINLSITFKDREPKLFEDWGKNKSLGSTGGSGGGECEAGSGKDKKGGTGGGTDASKSSGKGKKVKQSSNYQDAREYYSSHNHSYQDAREYHSSHSRQNYTSDFGEWTGV